MKAWIARDDDGLLTLWPVDPTWSNTLGAWVSLHKGTLLSVAFEALFSHVKRGEKQPIELTATPLGPAVRGGE